LQTNEAHQTFIQNLSAVYDLGEARSIARIVFEDALRVYDIQSKAPLFSIQEEELQNIQSRLLQHEPIQYILGQADFYGLKFKVNRNVLIPRQETEELVFWILETIQKEIKNSNLKILDIGTGSGCIPITLKKKIPQLNISAIDISTEALEIAKHNADLNKTLIEFIQNDILNDNQQQVLTFYDIIVSNPPYIPLVERALLASNVTEFEPALALFVTDENPLIFYNRIAEFAKANLNTNGYLFFECNEYNAGEVSQLLEREGFKNVTLQKDINGKERMIRCQI
jgi:release factor glutamine methyltransferase